ncbi:MAG: potassium-transporting ATPase subunit KdpA [bacterium]|nr:potassium-transporting ATPase subunit KdpA [bacterium]
MDALTLAQFAVYFALLALLAAPLGRYLADVYEGRARLAQRLLGPFERRIYRLAPARPRTRRCPGAATPSACSCSTSRAPWPSTCCSGGRARCP